MTPTQAIHDQGKRARDYRAARREHPRMRAIDAWRVASHDQGKDGLPDDISEPWGLNGYTVSATIEQDTDPDTSFYGEFTNDGYQDGAIRYPESVWNSRVYRWFVPAYSYSDRRDDYRRMGYGRHAADCAARADIRRDMEAAAEAEQYVVWVRVSRAGVVLGDMAIGGIDMGRDWLPDINDRYVREVVGDALHDAMAEAKHRVEQICKVGA